MPTLTLYLTDETIKQLDEIVQIQTETEERRVSRGDVLTPYIKRTHRTLTASRRRVERKHQAPITGELKGIVQ